MRAVVLEGPDGSGKSTLAAELAKGGIPVTKNGPPPEKIDLLWHYIAQLREGGVIDRSALSERIYGPPLRGRDRIGHAGWQTFQAVCAQEDVIQVICLPPPEICHERWRERADRGLELTVDEAVFWRTYAHYAWLAQGGSKYAGRFGVHTLDWTAKDWQGRIEWLRSRITEAR